MRMATTAIFLFALPILAQQSEQPPSAPAEWTESPKIAPAPVPYLLILPGCEGEGFKYGKVKEGLRDGGYCGDIEVFDWTTGHWSLFGYHLGAWERNQLRAKDIACRIVELQDLHPGRPIQLLGHSCGAAMAILALEALPPDRKVSTVVLLSAAVSPKYDLSCALGHVDCSMINFYSSHDLIFLRAGAMMVGTLDRKHCFAAGGVGFKPPACSCANYDKLRQEPYSLKMAHAGYLGGHMGCLHRKFVAQWIAPLFISSDY